MIVNTCRSPGKAALRAHKMQGDQEPQAGFPWSILFINPGRILLFKCESMGWNFATFTSNVSFFSVGKLIIALNIDHVNAAQSSTVSGIPIIKPCFKVFYLRRWNAIWMQPDICEFHFGKNSLCLLWLRCDWFLFLIIYRSIKCFFFHDSSSATTDTHKKLLHSILQEI